LRYPAPMTILRQLWELMPSGGAPEDVWRSRFRFLVGLAWFHAVVIALVGPVLGWNPELSLHALFDDDYALHTVLEGSVVGLFALVASWRRLGRTVQATLVGFGLLSSSAILVHLSGGVIELHFHFFVMLAFLALCQDWRASMRASCSAPASAAWWPGATTNARSRRRR
jgi:hypothetical protein